MGELFDAPVEIGAIANDAFDLIGIAPMFGIRLPKGDIVWLITLGRFQIDDAMDAVGHIFEWQGAICFKQDSVSLCQQSRHQQNRFLTLTHGFSAGDFYRLALIRIHLLFDIIERHALTLCKRIRRVTPTAAQITSRETHEYTGDTGKRRFPLNGIENFVDAKHEPLFPRQFGQGIGQKTDACNIDGISPEPIFFDPRTDDQAICFGTEGGNIGNIYT